MQVVWSGVQQCNGWVVRKSADLTRGQAGGILILFSTLRLLPFGKWLPEQPTVNYGTLASCLHSRRIRWLSANDGAASAVPAEVTRAPSEWMAVSLLLVKGLLSTPHAWCSGTGDFALFEISCCAVFTLANPVQVAIVVKMWSFSGHNILAARRPLPPQQKYCAGTTPPSMCASPPG